MKLLPPVRLPLAHLPTPLEPVERLDEVRDIELWVKRDDLTGAALSGNKVRKLEFLVADALARGADTLVTCGAVTSNHARATALSAARMGLRAHLVLRGEDEDPPQGNLLLDRIVGADVTFIAPEAWPDREKIMAGVAATLETSDRRAYVIPEGGSNHIGSMGYAVMVSELLEQEHAMGIRIGTVVVACGSGGTLAGLALGFAAADRPEVDVVGIAVCDDAAYFERVVADILDACAHVGYTSAEVARRARFRVIDAYKGPGYGQWDEGDLDSIRGVAATEGLVLDPVYTNKAFRGLVAESAAGRLGQDGATVFVHTGGVFGLFQLADAFRV